jgi:diguanylate cyclase (GGDEF)-like protein
MRITVRHRTYGGPFEANDFHPLCSIQCCRAGRNPLTRVFRAVDLRLDRPLQNGRLEYGIARQYLRRRYRKPSDIHLCEKNRVLTQSMRVGAHTVIHVKSETPTSVKSRILPSVRILIVHAHCVIREGLVILLERGGGNVVGTAATGQLAVTTARRLRPDVIVMDLSLPALDGIEAMRRIASETPQTRLIALSSSPAIGDVYFALGAGASGYVLNSAAGAELMNAVKAVTASHTYISSAITTILIADALTTETPHKSSEPFCARERGHLRYLQEGSTNRGIVPQWPSSLSALEERDLLLGFAEILPDRQRMLISQDIVETDMTQMVEVNLSAMPTILIVDADDLVCLRLREQVVAAGYDVRTAASVGQALRFLENASASIIVVDLLAAEIDSLDLCRHIRELAGPAYIYVAQLTAGDEESEILAALGAGADDYVSKRTSDAKLRVLLQSAKRVLALDHALRDATQKIRRLTMNDPLTGVYNRRYFVQHLGREMKRVQRFGGDLALLLLDVDHLQKINDTYGYVIGNLALKHLTRQIAKYLPRATDWCARLRGQEFAVVLEGTKLVDAHNCAEKLRRAIAESAIKTSAGAIRFTVSIGVSDVDGIAEKTPATVQSLLANADTRLFASKLCGRNRVTSSDSIGPQDGIRGPRPRAYTRPAAA